MFRTSRSSSGPPRRQIQVLFVSLHCGIPKAHRIHLQKQKYISSIYTSLYTFATVNETGEHLGSHNAEKLTTLGSLFLEGPRMTD